MVEALRLAFWPHISRFSCNGLCIRSLYACGVSADTSHTPHDTTLIKNPYIINHQKWRSLYSPNMSEMEWGGVRCEWGVCVHTTQHINVCQSARCVCLSEVWGRKWNMSSHKATPKELVLTVRLGQSRCLPRAVRLFAYDSLGGVLDVSVKSSSFFLNICSYHIVQLLSYIFE